MFLCVWVCLCAVLEFRLPESVSASLFLCHCVSRLIAGPSGEIDLRNQITKLSNSFIDWLSLLSLSLAPLPSSLFILLSPSAFSLHFPSLWFLQLFHPLSFPFPPPSVPPHSVLSPRFASTLTTKQVGRRVRRRSLIAAGRPASVFRCHGDAMESGTVRMEQTRSSALQVGLRKRELEWNKNTAPTSWFELWNFNYI